MKTTTAKKIAAAQKMTRPTAAEIAAAAAIFGRAGGLSKSPRKIAAVKRNGKKGGRPKKKA